MKQALLNIAPVMMLTPLFVRASVPFSIMPGWDSDPMLTHDAGAMGTLGPAGSLALDACVLTGAAVWSTAGQMQDHGRQAAGWWWETVGRLASTGVLLLAVPTLLSLAVGWTEQDLRIGMSWLSAIVALCTVAAASRADTRVRGLVGALTLGFLALLACRAGLQFLVEHPQTVADFQRNKEQFLLSRGWTEGSTSARAYERRLSQPDASAWFALSNVLASFAAAVTVVFSGLAWALVRANQKERNTPRARFCAAVALGVATSIAALWFAHSKGGVIALITGQLALLAMLVAMTGRCRPWRLPTVLAVGLGAIVGPIALVVARGLLGERLGELSLLFRWFYMQGAAGILAKFPLTGIGPDGFQQAFLLTKPALCPEDPSSAHSVLFDWAACLGLAGLVLGLTLIALSVFISASPFRAMNDRSPQPDTHTSTMLSPRLVLLIPALATIVSAWIETPGMSPASAMARVAGLIGWCMIAGLLWQPLTKAFSSADGRTRGRVYAAFAAGALTLIAHGQIEVTLTWTPAVGLAGMMIGVAWWRGAPWNPIPVSQAESLWSRFRSAAWIVVLVIFVAKFLLPNVTWCVRSERSARAASALLAPLGQANTHLADLRLRTLRGEATPADLRAELEDIMRSLSKSYDPSRAPSCEHVEDPIQRELARATIALGAAATERLNLPAAYRDWRFDRALAEVHIRVATAASDARVDSVAQRHMHDAVSASFSNREAVVQQGTTLSHAMSARAGMNVPLLRTKSLILLARADLIEQLRTRSTSESEQQSMTQQIVSDMLEALRSLKRAHELDPTSPDHPATIAELTLAILHRFPPTSPGSGGPHLSHPDPSEPAMWAGKALQLNELTRLDPVGRALAESRAERLRRIAYN